MISFKACEPTEHETLQLARLLQDEAAASRTMEKIIYESRRKGRDHYTVLHRRLELT